MNVHPIIHSGLVRERQQDLGRAMRTRRLAVLARTGDEAAVDDLAIRPAMPGGDVAPARVAELEGVCGATS